MANPKTGPIKIVNPDHTDLVSRYMVLQKAYRALEKKYKKLEETSVTWSVLDFMDYESDDYEISKKQAKSALKEMIKDHDCNVGITWDVVDFYYEKWGTKIN